MRRPYHADVGFTFCPPPSSVSSRKSTRRGKFVKKALESAAAKAAKSRQPGPGVEDMSHGLIPEGGHERSSPQSSPSMPPPLSAAVGSSDPKSRHPGSGVANAASACIVLRSLFDRFMRKCLISYISCGSCSSVTCSG